MKRQSQIYLWVSFLVFVHLPLFLYLGGGIASVTNESAGTQVVFPQRASLALPSDVPGGMGVRLSASLPPGLQPPLPRTHPQSHVQ